MKKMKPQITQITQIFLFFLRVPLCKKVTGAGDRCRWGNKRGIPNYNIRNYKKKTKGGHGLHNSSFKLQNMTAFNEKFLRGGPGGAVFSKIAPPGRRRQEK
jgi:hypothetical protein